MLDKLREIAIRFQIDPLVSVEHTAKVTTVIKVLTEMNKSFTNFLEVEFMKNEAFRSVAAKNDKVFDTLKEDLELRFVDLKFGSFEAAVAPYFSDEKQTTLFRNDVIEWEKETFDTYKGLIVEGNFQESGYMRKIAKRYSDEERQKIFQPLFSAFGNGKDYSLNLRDSQGKTKMKLVQPAKEKYPFYVPKIEKAKEEPTYATVQAFMKVEKQGESYTFNKRSVKQVFLVEELEHDTYPFKPNMVRFDDVVYVLNDKLDCIVDFEDDNYTIKNELFDLSVWGDTREEVESAFAFSFHALYQNFASEEDRKLSLESKELKNKLLKLVKTVLHETKKD